MPPRLRPEFVEVLSGLRRRIRAFVLVEGAARVVILLGLLFWGSLLLDWGWFALSRLELPAWFRTAIVVGAVGLIAFGLMTWLVLRMAPGLRAKALALVLEKRFPELDDRLITAVEMAEGRTGREPPLTQAMLDRTVDDAARLVPSLQLGSVFEKKTLQRALVFAVVLVASIIGFGVMNADAMDRWYKAYVLRLDRYWRRETDLVVKVIVQPGDRERAFRESRYKHAKGTDLTLLIEVPEGKRPDGGEWVVPDLIDLSYTLDGGRGSGVVTLTRFGDRQYRHTFGSLLDGMHFRVRGNDYTNRVPYRVEVVDPPHVDQLVLDSDFPAYTGLNQEGQRELRVQGTQIAIPAETRFVLRGAVNKTLTSVRIEYGATRLSFGWSRETPANGNGEEPAGPEKFAATMLVDEEEGRTATNVPVDQGVAAKFLADDRKSFAVPFVMSARETEAAQKRAAEALPGALSGFGVPFVLPPDTPMRIYLEDTDEIIAIEPARLTVNSTPDQPPLVQAELKGIGTSITRRAIIPVKGLVTDDYGLTKVRFDYRIDDGEDWIPSPMKRKLEGTPKEFPLEASEEDPTEKLDILPLELATGKKLTLSVYASDGDDLNGPHETRGESQFVFTIVSNEELLSILYGREVNLRQRFRQIMDEVEGTRKDLILHKVKHEESETLKKSLAAASADQRKPEDERKQEELEIAVAVSAERALHQVRKNAGETAVIEEAFAALLEELVNNRVHTEQMVERIEGLIVKPLHAINTIDYPNVDGSIGLFKLALEKKQDPIARIDDSVEAINAMLEHMEKVLKEMQDLANFHEAIAELKLIIDDNEKVRSETIKKQKEDFLRGVKKPGEGKPEEKKPEGKPEGKKE